mgnify:FL=1
MGKIHWSGGSADLRIGCERERGNRFGSIQHRSWPASVFVERATASPDHHCAHCAKAARLALAAESAPKPDTVIWPKPRPISEARETEIFGYCPDIGWRRLSQTGRKWALTGAEHIADYEPTHFLPLPPEVM